MVFEMKSRIKNNNNNEDIEKKRIEKKWGEGYIWGEDESI